MTSAKKITKKSQAAKPVRVIAVTSGKGGVGKTNLTTNLALALSARGHKVLVWDADLGLANIDVLLGLSAEYNIHHLLNGEKSLNEIIIPGPGGIMIMPAASGILELSEISEGQKARLLSEFDDFGEELDFLLIDTAAGIGSNVVYFNLAAQERLVVVTNEPTSITDAYALMKVLYTRYQQKSFCLLPNQVSGAKEAKKVFELLVSVADQHLPQISMDMLGWIPKDESVIKAVRKQEPFMISAPGSPAALQMTKLATALAASAPKTTDGGGLVFFLNRLAHLGGRVD